MIKRLKDSAFLLAVLLVVIQLQSYTSVDKNEEETKPNIIMILADDLGYGDLGCYGHPYAETPNIDRLATEGIKFTRFYATGVTCSPSRTGFMTGRHPASFEKYMPNFGFSERPAITEILQNNGYTTGHVGKWHISGNKNPKPNTYGIENIQIIGKSKDKSKGKDDDLFDAAIEFVEKNRDRPFYLNVWGHISHYSVDPHEKFPAHFKDLEVKDEDFDSHFQHKLRRSASLVPDLNVAMRNYLGEVWALDLAVGRLLDKLDELGLKENTIVVFSSDQGPAPNKLHINEDGDSTLTANMLGSAGNLRGGKHEQYEGGVRIPFIVRYPAKVPTNKTNDVSILSGLDWLPTLCGITNTYYPKSEIEGMDVSDIWFGEEKELDRYLCWKVSNVKGKVSILHGNWKGHETPKNGFELYDLSTDPEELTDVAGKFPEIVLDLKKKAKEWEATLPTQYIKKEKKKKKKK